MTSKTSIVTFERDTSSVTDRDISRAHALLTEGCHAVTVRDVTQRSVTFERDIRSVTGPALNAGPSKIWTRPRARSCANCQVSQGRNCACRGKISKRRPLSATEWLWLVIAFDVAMLWLVGWGVVQLWRAM